MENIVYKILEQEYRDDFDNLANIIEEYDYKSVSYTHLRAHETV